MAADGDGGKLGRRGLVSVPRCCRRVAKPIRGVGGVYSVCRGPRRRGAGGAEPRRGVSGSKRRRGIGDFEQVRGVGGSERRRGIGGSERRRGMGGSERKRDVGGSGRCWGRRDRQSRKACGHGRGPRVGRCVGRSKLGYVCWCRRNP